MMGSVTVEMVDRHLPIVCFDAVPGPGRQNVAIRDDLDEPGQMSPSFRPEEIVPVNSTKEPLHLCRAVVNNLDFLSSDEAPQGHKTVYGGVHGEEIGVNDWNRYFSNVCASATTEECRFCV